MQLHTLISSENGPIILWVMYPHRGDELEHTADSIRELVGEEQFTLVAIQIDDWNRDLSPWRSDEVDGSFAGEAGRTLDYIEQQVIPQLDIQSQANRPLYIMGYSLAGLFCTLGNVSDGYICRVCHMFRFNVVSGICGICKQPANTCE